MSNTVETIQQSPESKLPDLNLQQIQQNVTINHSALNNEPLASFTLDAKSKNMKSKKAEFKKYEKGVEDNPEYFRVDMQICHKIYEIYRKLRLGHTQQQSSFQQKEERNTTMNYHKIMQIFKDIQVKLEINQKLTILRSIKKFCFNQNFINLEEFTKIFKVIVHGLGLKQTIFKPIIQAKYSSAAERQQSFHKKAISIKLNKNITHKLKTQPTIQQIRTKSQVHALQSGAKENKTLQAIKKNNNLSFHKNLQITQQISALEGSQVTTARKIQSRKRMATEVSRYQSGQGKGYLNRAMQKNKANKVTWQSLFKMNRTNLYNNICIPHFISQDIEIEDPYF